MLNTIIIPKGFAAICALIRDNQSEGIEQLNAYPGLERQKTAVLAEVAYFDGEFEVGLESDMTLCSFWDEWHYSNVRTEHTAAMAFAAQMMGRQDEMISFFDGQISLLKNDTDIDTPEHIKNAKIKNYENRIEHLKTGIVPYYTEKETYKLPEAVVALDDLRAEVAKANKKLDMDSSDGQFALFKTVCTKGTLEDMLTIYETIADNNLSTVWHINALVGYNYARNTEKALEVVLRMARQRLWIVASETQVRPMEFFTHPSMFGFLSDRDSLERIKQAACHQ